MTHETRSMEWLVIAVLMALILTALAWAHTWGVSHHNGATVPRSMDELEYLEAHGFICQRNGGHYECR